MPEHLQRVRSGFPCLLVGLAARGAAGQQFQEQSGVLPVPKDYWIESVTAVDADEDGSADVSVPLPSGEVFAGLVLDLQAFALDPSQPHGVAASNGLEVAVCAP